MVPLREPSRWPLAAIQAGAGLFIVALVISVLFDPAIWLLHTLQALIYVAVIVLARRETAPGALVLASLLPSYGTPPISSRRPSSPLESTHSGRCCAPATWPGPSCCSSWSAPEVTS
jgi:hypothetical protein